MLFLLGVRTHPVIRVLIGAAVLIAGLILASRILLGAGLLVLLYGGFTWYRRVRGNARQQEARLHKEGTVR